MHMPRRPPQDFQQLISPLPCLQPSRYCKMYEAGVSGGGDGQSGCLLASQLPAHPIRCCLPGLAHFLNCQCRALCPPTPRPIPTQTPLDPPPSPRPLLLLHHHLEPAWTCTRSARPGPSSVNATPSKSGVPRPPRPLCAPSPGKLSPPPLQPPNALLLTASLTPSLPSPLHPVCSSDWMMGTPDAPGACQVSLMVPPGARQLYGQAHCWHARAGWRSSPQRSQLISLHVITNAWLSFFFQASCGLCGDYNDGGIVPDDCQDLNENCE